MSNIAVIHDNRDKGGDLGVVAFLEFELNGRLTDSDILEEAFKRTNSIDTNWYENDGPSARCAGMTKMFDGAACRSTMVGDFVLIGNVKWKCEPTGWVEL